MNMLIGHQKQQEMLKKIVESGRIPHAFLFFGQEKIGKKTLALEFAKLLNCKNSILGVPCENCPSCNAFQKKLHPDFIFIEAENKEIKIAQIKEMIWKLSLKPFLSFFKIVLIDQAHLLNQEARDALLKTLEEPRGDTILILITEYPETLSSTILSRVQKIKFQPVDLIEIKEYLKTQKFSDREIEEIIWFSIGSPGKAIDFASNPEKLKIHKQKINEFAKILNSDLVSRFQYVKNLSLENDFRENLVLWLRIFQEVLKTKFYPLQRLSKCPFIDVEKILPAGKIYSLFKIKNILQKIQYMNFLLSTTNINPCLSLEILMLEF